MNDTTAALPTDIYSLFALLVGRPADKVFRAMVIDDRYISVKYEESEIRIWWDTQMPDDRLGPTRHDR